MDLVESDNNSDEQTTRRVTTTTTEPEPTGLAWLRVVGLIFLAIVLIILIVIFARWVYHKVHHATVNAPTTTLSQPLDSSDKTNNGAQPAPAGGSSAPTNTSTGGTPATPPANQSAKLPNNGPGSVAAIFVGTSLAAAGIHYAVTSRRLNKTTN